MLAGIPIWDSNFFRRFTLIFARLRSFSNFLTDVREFRQILQKLAEFPFKFQIDDFSSRFSHNLV